MKLRQVLVSILMIPILLSVAAPVAIQKEHKNKNQMTLKELKELIKDYDHKVLDRLAPENLQELQKHYDRATLEDYLRLLKLYDISVKALSAKDHSIEMPAIITGKCLEHEFVTSIGVLNKSSEKINKIELGWYVVQYNKDRTDKKIITGSYKKYTLDRSLNPGEGIWQDIKLNLASIAKDLYARKILPVDNKPLIIDVVLYINQVYFEKRTGDIPELRRRDSNLDLAALASEEPEARIGYCTGGELSTHVPGVDFLRMRERSNY